MLLEGVVSRVELRLVVDAILGHSHESVLEFTFQLVDLIECFLVFLFELKHIFLMF